MNRIVSKLPPLSILLFIFLLAGCQLYADNTEPIYPNLVTDMSEMEASLPSFTFINQDRVEVSLDDVLGQVWLANLIFTNCDTVCMPMTANMERIQKQLEEEGLDVPIISFSVDPENDTPEQLQQFIEMYDLNLDSWHFLTGYSFEEIQEISVSAFKSILEEEAGSNQFIHGTAFYLINEHGQVIRRYNGLNVPDEDILKDVNIFMK